MSDKKVTLDYCRGSQEGYAIYLNQEDSDGAGWGYRVAGPKCWGKVIPVASYPMDKRELENLISQATGVLEWLRRDTATEKEQS